MRAMSAMAILLATHTTPRRQGFDDDGEPSGTAGKPILNVLQHRALVTAWSLWCVTLAVSNLVQVG